MICLSVIICTTGISLSRNIHTYTSVFFMYSLFMALPLKNPALLLTWRPPVVKRVVPSSPRLLVNCPFVPHCSQMFLASLPPGFPQNPNVLLIRTHPNPFPSVGYTDYDAGMPMPD